MGCTLHGHVGMMTLKVNRHLNRPQNQATEKLRYDTNKAVQSLRVTRCMVQIVKRLCPNSKGKTTRYQRKIYMCMRLTIIKTLAFSFL